MLGAGHAGPDPTPKEYQDRLAQARDTAESAIGKAQRELALEAGEVHILGGDPGAASVNVRPICPPAPCGRLSG